MNIKLKLIGACALVGAFAATPASAEWIQYSTIGQKTTNLGGAGVATASDYDVFYANPAGAANITRPTIGVGLKVLNTTNLENKEPGFNHGVDDTVTGSDNAYLPSVGAYVPGLLPNVTLGVGFGAVAALAADWGSDTPKVNVFGNIGGANPFGNNSTGFQKVELLATEISPTIGIKLTDKLNVGASIGLTTVKHLSAQIAVFLPNAFTQLGSDATVQLLAQTDDDLGLPIPPWEFATSPREVTFTLGAQYQLLPNVAIGGVFRSEAPTEYDVNLALNNPFVNGGGLGGLSLTAIERDRGTFRLEIPRHVQIGATIDVMPGLRVSGDVKWTNWANATGIGSPLVVHIAGDLGSGLGEIAGGAANDGVACQSANNQSCIKQLIASPHNGDDTYSFHLGIQYMVLPNVELQAGYNYDPAVFDKGNLSFLAYSSDRHIYSLGATVELPDSALFGTSGDWEWTVGGQLVDYEDVTVQTGQSQTFGLGTGAAGVPTTTFAPNENSFEIGGYIWSVGVSGVYKFGVPEEIALK